MKVELIIPLGLGVLALAAASSAGAKPGPTPPLPNELEVVNPRQWVDPDAPARICALAQSIEDLGVFPGQLCQFLAAKAFIESRGNRKAQNGTSANAARGWFGMRPASGLAHEFADRGQFPADLLKEEKWSVAMAAWYAYRLLPYASKGQAVDWLAIARGWALPRLVSDVDETAEVNSTKPGSKPPRKYYPGERSQDVRERLEDGLLETGQDPDWMYTRVQVGAWPGIATVLDAVGIR